MGSVLNAMRFHVLGAILDWHGWLAHFPSISSVQFFSPGNWYLFCGSFTGETSASLFMTGLFIVFSHSFQLRLFFIGKAPF